MPWLIDGDNLLGTWPRRRRSAAERREVARELARFGARRGRRVVTVFDGPEDRTRPARARVHYSGTGRSADERILEILAEQPDPRGWTVVTSDRSLGDRCRHLQARVERCDRFRRRLLEAPAEEKPDPAEDLDYWAGRFGVTKPEGGSTDPTRG